MAEDTKEEINDDLSDLKAYLHIVSSEDDTNLKSLLNTAHATLKRWCGLFDLENEEGKQLVFDYVRYMHAGASEYFYKNFQTQIISFGFSLMEVPADDAIPKTK